MECWTGDSVYSHIIIIGGTGMLASASATLARRCRTLTSVARTRRSLQALDARIASPDCTHHMLALDWSARDAFIDALARHVRHVGAPALVLAWLHDDELGLRLDKILASTTSRCAFFLVRGSAVADPADHTESFVHEHDIPASIDYRQIILGFHRGAAGSRWLHDSEISTGVIAAIDDPKPRTMVGSVAPWSAHP